MGSLGYTWSSAPFSATEVRGLNLYFSSSGVNPEYSFNRAGGFPVRCVQE